MPSWGKYEPAIRRWEEVMGPAPAPVTPGAKGQPRLSPLFTEWMMGQPAGWITDPAIGITRNEQIKLCGNGVVTQQAAAALLDMLDGFGALG
jgi:DNA (cytosine-5)-methyltransferase 1